MGERLAQSRRLPGRGGKKEDRMTRMQMVNLLAVRGHDKQDRK
jgi:hypothetical protein